MPSWTETVQRAQSRKSPMAKGALQGQGLRGQGPKGGPTRPTDKGANGPMTQSTGEAVQSGCRNHKKEKIPVVTVLHARNTCENLGVHSFAPKIQSDLTNE